MRTLLPTCLALLLAITPLPAEEPVPPAPAGHVLDQANVMLPEAAAKLSEQLVAAKRGASVNVYLVTIRSLGTTYTKQNERLVEFGNKLAANWLNALRGAVVAFDDESGLVTVVYSKDAKETFSELELDQTMTAPLAVIQRGGEKRDKILDRDKLERTTTLVVDTFTAFENKAHRRQLKLWVLFGGVAVVVLVSIGFELLLASGRRKEDPVGSNAASQEANPPNKA